MRISDWSSDVCSSDLFIKRSRDLGFTLDQVRALLRLSADPRGSCAEADQIAAVHIAEIDRKLADPTALRSEIAQWGDTCNARMVAECQVIDALSHFTKPSSEERLVGKECLKSVEYRV